MSIIAEVIAFTPSGLAPEAESELRAAFPATGLHLSRYCLRVDCESNGVLAQPDSVGARSPNTPATDTRTRE